MEKYLLEMTGITKHFSGVVALQDVSFNLKSGEVHSIMGENGAGKSTLMKVLSGVYTADNGTIRIDGKEVAIGSPAKAIELGIGMVHQELSNVQEMTVAENIFLGKEPVRLGVVDFNKMNSEAEKLLKPLDFAYKPTTKISSLSVSNSQLVEIAKVLSQNAKIIVFDEPTSSITEDETERLFSIIRELKESGVGIIYISHKMDEIFKISDRITVLRDGHFIDSRPAKDYTENSLIEQMVGRTLDSIYPKEEVEFGEVVLEARNLTDGDEFADVSFKLRKGEILGFAGLIGAGRTEVMEAVFGTRKLVGGDVYIEGQKTVLKSPEQAIKHGIVYISEDRKQKGIIPVGSVSGNLTISALDKISKRGVLNAAEERQQVSDYIDKLSIKVSSQKQQIRNLSGGNQQKVLIARGMLTEPKVLILDEPTRGVDVGAKAEIHALISKLAKQGMGIIMISSEMPEIIGMSDRIIVMHEGQIVGELERQCFNQERIMNYASGLK